MMAVTTKLSVQQQKVVDWVAKGDGNAIVQARAGSGKCLGQGTKVMLFDGSIIPVEKVQVGHQLMGPDSRPRNVLSIVSGFDDLYKIVPTKGKPYIVNKDHILSLKVYRQRWPNIRLDDEIVNVSVLEYLRNERYYRKKSKGWRTAVEFRAQAVHQNMPPYLLGLWLGDGATGAAKISKPDREILRELEVYAKSVGCSVRSCVSEAAVKAGKCPTYQIGFERGTKEVGLHRNPMISALRDLGILNCKRVPKSYLRNSREVRLELLAGLVDSDGHVKNGGIDWISKSPDLARDFIYLCRSLGLAAYGSECQKSCQNDFTGIYYRVYVSGDCTIIPTRISRKSATPRLMNKDVLKVGLTIEKLNAGAYFGFELDGDGLFLLGDFTVTHNTSTVLESTRNVSGKACIAVFNKKIQQEIETRNTNPSVKVKTFHSLGWQALASEYDIRLDDQKHKRVQTELEVPKLVQPFVRKLVGLAKNNFLTVDNPQEWEETIDHFDVDFEIDLDPNTQKQQLESARELGTALAKDALLEHLRMVADESIVDFDDLMYAPLELDCPFPKHDWLMVDEAQDTGVTRRRIAEKLLKRDGRLLSVGDSFQSIYGFSGASADAMTQIKDQFKCKELPLTVSFRCSKAVIKLAQEYVKDIEAAPGAPEGSVSRLTYSDLFVSDLSKDDVVLCRYTKPLVKLAYEFIGQGTACHVEGREIGKGLIKMVQRFKKAKTVRKLLEQMGNYRAERYAMLVECGKEDAAAKLADQVETILIIAQNLKLDESVFTLTDTISNLFQDNAPTLTLSTIHRAKGREWERVHWLNNRKTGNKHARQQWMQDQERNLIYVAITRAKRDLVEVEMSNNR